MSGYNYQREKAFIFTDEGQKVFLKIRDRAHELLKTAGAFNWSRVTDISIGAVSTFELHACVDRLVELGEIVPLNDDGSTWGQYIVYYDGKKHNR